MYNYSAKVLEVKDADTIVVLADLGFKIFIELTLRLYGIDTPELSTPEGVEAKKFLFDTIWDKKVIIKTIKDKKEKYGRYLADIFLDDGSCINTILINKGFGKEYFGGKRGDV